MRIIKGSSFDKQIISYDYHLSFWQRGSIKRDRYYLLPLVFINMPFLFSCKIVCQEENMLSDKTIAKIDAFNKERDWDKYHNGKDLAISLAIEASELLEIYQWSGTDLDCDQNLGKIKEELADVLIYAVQIAQKYHLDLDDIVLEKMKRNAIKYPSPSKEY